MAMRWRRSSGRVLLSVPSGLLGHEQAVFQGADPRQREFGRAGVGGSDDDAPTELISAVHNGYTPGSKTGDEGQRRRLNKGRCAAVCANPYRHRRKPGTGSTDLQPRPETIRLDLTPETIRDSLARYI